jgi:uncharacterized protein with GYD domain
MPHFMVSCNYSAESKNALIANPVDRTKAASAAVEAVGGKLHSAFMPSGKRTSSSYMKHRTQLRPRHLL